LLALAGILVMLQAYVFTGMIVHQARQSSLWPA
jgi:hypothetical protein